MRSSTVIGGTSEKYERHDSDFYSTPIECTVALINFLESNEVVSNENLIWEPAVGDGAISKQLLKRGYTVAVSDLREDVDGVGGIDYLNSGFRAAKSVITNPPFDLSEAFIRRSISLELDMFAFLLKGQYWHSKNRLPLFCLQPPSYILPLTWRPVFVADRGKSPTMEFMWCVWQKENTETKYIPLQKPNS